MPEHVRFIATLPQGKPKHRTRWLMYGITGILAVFLSTPGAPARQSEYASLDAIERDRDKTIEPERVLDLVGVKPGMLIGEVGAGCGYFTFKLASRVGTSGKVYANDIDAERLGHLTRRAAERGLANIVTIVGGIDDPRFPPKALDLVWMVDTFHDLEKPVELLANIIPALKPGGRLVILDYDDDKAAKKLEYFGHFFTIEKTLGILAGSAFRIDRVETFLPMHMLLVLSPKGAESPGNADFSGVERFLALTAILERDQEPSIEQWDRLFSTPGYAVLLKREFRRDFFAGRFRLAFMPSKKTELEA
jgi:ubiquinone/menaquinone biosynthesis C-methylase UbiE